MPQLIFRPEPFEDYMEFDEWESGTDFELEGEVSRTSPDYIRWVQQSLNQLMGLQLAVDGKDGPKTRSAVRSFQQKRGLTVDGIVGAVTEAAMRAAGAPPPPGSTGGGTGAAPCTPAQRKTTTYIRWVQQSLNSALPTNLVVDGIKGQKTTAAVIAFQKRNGLLVDGIVGPQTEGALIRATGTLPPGCGGGTVPPVKGCPPHKARLRLHVKILVQPNIPISTQISNMQSVYGPAGFLVEVASTETLKLPDLEDLDLILPDGSSCHTGGTSTEQQQLFNNRNNVTTNELVVYFINSTNPPFNGCASHPPSRPGAVVVHDCSQWTLAHEIGHVLGLNHCDSKSSCLLDRLMTGCGTDSITNPPPDLITSEITTMDNSALTINC